MKRVMAFLLVTIFFLTGCGKADKGTDESKVEFYVNNVSLVPGEDFSKVKNDLGDPVDVMEAASCYFEGNDKIFTYDDYEVRTYPKDGTDVIQDICVKTDKFKTGKGITVGAGLSDITKAYGDNYKATGNMYKYYLDGDKYIYFFLLDDMVKFFGYAIDVAN